MRTVQVSEKVLLLVFISSRAREINSRYGGKTRRHMFPLCLYPDWHQYGVSIEISANLGKTFLRISRVCNIALT